MYLIFLQYYLKYTFLIAVMGKKICGIVGNYEAEENGVNTNMHSSPPSWVVSVF